MYVSPDTYRQEDDPTDPNTLLDEASPRVAEMTPELRSLLDEMVSVTRPRSRRPTRLALTAGGLGAAVVLGVAGTAAASIGTRSSRR